MRFAYSLAPGFRLHAARVRRFEPWTAHLVEPDDRSHRIRFPNHRDRSRLVARDVLPYVAAGGGRDLGDCWRLSLEVLYVPLSVRRDPEGASSNDPLTSFRAQLRYDGP